MFFSSVLFRPEWDEDGGERKGWRGRRPDGEVERWRQEGGKTDRWARWRDGALYLISTIR